MLNNFYNSALRQWAAGFLSAFFALGIVIPSREVFLMVEQPHIGQDRSGEESSLLYVNAETMYPNASPQTTNYTYSSLTARGEL